VSPTIFYSLGISHQIQQPHTLECRIDCKWLPGDKIEIMHKM